MPSLVEQALSISEEFDLDIFPLSTDKRPLAGYRWRQRATRDPKTIEADFALPGAALVGVPCGHQNDLLCFDLDFGHTDDPDRLAALSAWVARWESELDAMGARYHRTRSGGLHILTGYPHKRVPPRIIMPKFEVIREGFYFVWPTEGSGYEALNDAWTDEAPPDEMLEVVEKTGGGGGGGLMTADEADLVMRTDGDEGTRHEALLRMTKDWADERPSETLQQLCAGFADWFSDIYQLDEERSKQLLAWRVRREDGEAEGELGRAMKGAMTSPERAVAALAAALEKRGPKAKLMQGTVMRHQKAAPAGPDYSAREGQLFVEYDRHEAVRLRPWVIENICREGDMGGFSGVPALGKTNLTATMIAGLLSGDGPAAGLPEIPRPRAVAWANAEEPREEMKLRLDAALLELGLDPQADCVIAGQEQLLGGFASFLIRDGRDMVVNEKLVEIWVGELVKAGIEVLVIDPITEFNDGNENDRGDRKLLVTAIRQVAAKVGLTVLYWAHTGQQPEGKRDDWYDGNLYAERGSSGGIGSNQYGGTLVRLYPAGAKGQAALDWARGGDDPSNPIPKYLVLRVVKAKLGRAKPVLYWKVQSATHDPDIPVVIPVTEQVAHGDVASVNSTNEAMAKTPTAKELIDVLGVGTWDSLSTVHDAMRKAGAKYWPQIAALRADRGEGATLLKAWHTPLGLTYTRKGDEVARSWYVSIGAGTAGRSGKATFTLSISAD